MQAGNPRISIFLDFRRSGSPKYAGSRLVDFCLFVNTSNRDSNIKPVLAITSLEILPALPFRRLSTVNARVDHCGRYDTHVISSGNDQSHGADIVELPRDINSFKSIRSANSASSTNPNWTSVSRPAPLWTPRPFKSKWRLRFNHRVRLNRSTTCVRSHMYLCQIGSPTEIQMVPRAANRLSSHLRFVGILS